MLSFSKNKLRQRVGRKGAGARLTDLGRVKGLERVAHCLVGLQARRGVLAKGQVELLVDLNPCNPGAIVTAGSRNEGNQ